MRGYYGLAMYCPKNLINFGVLIRSANILGAKFVTLIGARFKNIHSDVLKTYRHVPVFEYEDFDTFYKHLPFSCQLVGVEMGDKSKNLNAFFHPERAVYLLGAEDNGLPDHVIDRCHHMVKCNGARSLNVSVAGSIVLHDRSMSQIDLLKG